MRPEASTAVISALRCRPRTSSARSTCCGKMRRASLVLTSNGGMATTATRSLGTAKRLQRNPCGVAATMVKPPMHAAAALSGWPSSVAAISSSSCLANGRPASCWQAAATPRKIVDELPMPRATGTSPLTRTINPGSAVFQRLAQASRTCPAMRAKPSSGASGATTAALLAGSTLMTLAAVRAMPRQSKPWPRLVVEAGTRKRSIGGSVR